MLTNCSFSVYSYNYNLQRETIYTRARVALTYRRNDQFVSLNDSLAHADFFGVITIKRRNKKKRRKKNVVVVLGQEFYGACNAIEANDTYRITNRVLSSSVKIYIHIYIYTRLIYIMHI